MIMLCCSVNGHNDLASVVRGSHYFTHPPVLPLLCVEIDGDQTNTPIIFEDIYKDESQGVFRLLVLYHSHWAILLI